MVRSRSSESLLGGLVLAEDEDGWRWRGREGDPAGLQSVAQGGDCSSRYPPWCDVAVLIDGIVMKMREQPWRREAGGGSGW
jgi:hypothetical protein